MTEYITAGGRVAPQLTRADLKTLSPQEVVQAHANGQFRVLLEKGRDPIDPEIRGERWATDAEHAAALTDQAQQYATQNTIEEQP